MSQTESETVPPVPAATAEVTARQQPGIARRVIGWYLCQPERDDARRAVTTSAREAELLERAKAAIVAGNILREPSDPSRKRLAAAQAATLYVEALTWALWAFRTGAEKPNSEELWRETSPLVRDLRLTPERVSEVTRLLAAPKVGVELAERSGREQAAAAALLKHAALAAIDTRERPMRIVDGLTLIAIARVTLTVLVFGVLVGAAVILRPQKPNLAAGKPWRASSSLFECHPEQGECGGAKTRILFHTRDEQNPWFQYDLLTKTSFSSLRIENRQDGEAERAVPLVVEVGDDGVHFREVARRTDEFSTWKPSFPAVSARYVRLRALRKTMLHLEEIDVYK